MPDPKNIGIGAGAGQLLTGDPVTGALVGGLFHRGSGQAGRDRANEQQQFENMTWDPNTFMPDLNTAPPAAQAANYDWQSQKLYQQAKARYFQDALGSNQQAMTTLGQYRPGGGAMAASNVLQNRGAMQVQIGNSLERPDVYANKREQAAQQAKQAADKAGQMAMIGGMVQGAATVAGGMFGGPAGASAGSALGGMASQGIQGGAQAGLAGAQAGLANAQMAGSSGPGRGGGGGGAGPQPLQMQSGGAGGGGGGGGGAQSPGSLGGGGLMGASVGMGGGGAASPLQAAQQAQFQDAFSQMIADDLDMDFSGAIGEKIDYHVDRAPGGNRPLSRAHYRK